MPTERITFIADTIDDAAEQIIHLLEGTHNRRDVIYFHGWFGFGASAVLKAVVKKLRSSSGLDDTRTARDLGKIIHVDVSLWQSKRALQKVIAEELELPPQVMALFDQHDEEDDFDRVEQSARGVIPYVKVAIMNELIARRFLVVLHNGSGSYIDLWEVGVPVMGQLSKRVLWTSRGRFWHHAQDGHAAELHLVKLESATKWSDAVILVFPAQLFDNVAGMQVIRHALYAEAEEVAKYTGVPELVMTPKIVMECILYRALLSGNDHNINWESHASNYWVCDGIIQDGIIDGGGSAWEISDALQRNMNLDLCDDCTEAISEALSDERQRFANRWVYATDKDLPTEVQLTSQATSFFWTGGARLELEACLLEHSNKSSLRVIHLSHCTFSFSSPPFQSCSNLRFLLLDHCKDKDNAQDDGEENDNCHHHSHHSRENGGAWFRNLWVLELSHTDWYWLLSKGMLDLMSNLRELNVKGVGNRSMSHLHRCSGAGSNNSRRKLLKLRVVAEAESSNNSRRKLLKLRVVAEAESSKDDGHDGAGGDTIQQVSPQVVASSFPDLSSWHSLKTIVLDGCGDLEIIGSDALPLSLEIFSLTGNDNTKIKSISFRGCTQLKSLLLRGNLHSLEELDMSGTTIKMLDLSTTQAKGLKRLFLLGCEKLRAILWPQQEENEKTLEVLRIDTSSTLSAWDRKDKSHKQEEATSSSDNTSTVVGSSAAALCGNNDRAITTLDWYISLRDPRIFRSFLNLRYAKFLHVEISSASGHKGTKQGANSDSGGSDRQQVRAAGSNLYYDDDIISIFGSNSSQSGGGASISNGHVFEALEMRNMWIWPCPPIPETPDDWPHCYISIQDEKHADELLLQGTTTRQLPSAITLPSFVNEDAGTLHLHDSLSITSLPGPTVVVAQDLNWHYLRWCRLERCPNLEGVVFTPPYIGGTDDEADGEIYIFQDLETFWASQLMKARYIWDWSKSVLFLLGSKSFEHLTFLHLDYCPRLVHVLPLYPSNSKGCQRLETLEIVCCDNLMEIFPSDEHSGSQQEPREFPSLKRIHLYELPKLQRICGRRMLTPNLEIVKIRGCWSLKRLPCVRQPGVPPPARRTRIITWLDYERDLRRQLMRTLNHPTVDCEKDWWERLEWDGEAAGHHPSHYKLTHSAYWNKTQLKTSLLR